MFVTSLGEVKRKTLIFAWFICLLVASFYSYDLFIRVAPSVMTHGIESDFHIDAASLGVLSAAYFYSYIVFQLPAGIILDKYSCRWVISGAMFLCLLGNFVFSIAPNYELAFTGRILMGIGSAFGFIGAAKIASIWLPNRYFSTFMSITVFIGCLGGLIADTALNTLVHEFGWRYGNNVFTYIGVMIFLLMILFIKDRESLRKVPDRPHLSLRAQIKILGKILINWPFWSVSLVGAIMFIPINVLASLWGVGFIQAKLGVDQSIAAHINSLLFIGSAIGFVIISIISAYTKRYRLLLVISCVSLTVISLLIIFVSMPVWLFTILMMLMGVSIGPQALTFEVGKFFSPKGSAASAVAGINMINNIVGALLLPLFGLILMTMQGMDALNVEPSLHDYYYAMSMVPILTLVCLPLCLFLPKRVV